MLQFSIINRLRFAVFLRKKVVFLAEFDLRVAQPDMFDDHGISDNFEFAFEISIHGKIDRMVDRPGFRTPILQHFFEKVLLSTCSSPVQ